jgi:endonuclease IV
MKKNINPLESVNLGIHAPFHAPTISSLRKKGLRAVQVFLGSPVSWKPIDKNKEKYLAEIKKLPKDLKLIVHAPYLLNLVKGDHLTKASLGLIKKIISFCGETGISSVVVHPGYRMNEREKAAGHGVSWEQALKNLGSSCQELQPELKASGVTLCLESMAGDAGGKQMGFADDLLKVTASLNAPEISFCLDTQHTFASGIDISKPETLSVLSNAASVIHLNGNKQLLGSHKDLHGTVALKDTTGYGEKEFLSLLTTKKPAIMEIDSDFILQENLNFLIPLLSKNQIREL